MSDLVENPEDRFSHNVALLMCMFAKYISPLSLEGGILVLMVPVPVHCLPVTFYINEYRSMTGQATPSCQNNSKLIDHMCFWSFVACFFHYITKFDLVVK